MSPKRYRKYKQIRDLLQTMLTEVFPDFTQCIIMRHRRGIHVQVLVQAILVEVFPAILKFHKPNAGTVPKQKTWSYLPHQRNGNRRETSYSDSQRAYAMTVSAAHIIKIK